MAERVWLDRIEGERAVLLLGEEGRETAIIPRRLLPGHAREGMAFDLALSAAPEDDTRGRVQDLMDELFDA